ncbi:MAG: hypothetical protein QOF55_1294 [Thermoleophilaceae bacterium]|nr:hypothetical protein [Thermoleophilaceae bacterium]
MPRAIRPLLTICAIALLAPVAAQAQTPAPTEIDGSPLNTWVSADGGVNFNVDGFTRSEWYPYASFDPVSGNAIPSPNGNAGFGLIVNPEGSPLHFGRFLAGSMPAPTSGPTLAPGTPTTVSTTWSLKDSQGAPLVDLTQVLSYTNGSRQVDASYAVKNVSSSAISFRANVAGDLAIRGSDTGIGFLTPGPPRFMGGLNQDVGAAGGFVEGTPWTHYESGNLSTVGSHANDNAAAGGFNDTLSTDPTDNAAGVQWDDHFAAANALPPGQTANYTVGWKFIDTLGLTPPTATHFTGEEQVLTATVGDLNGAQVKQQTVTYSIAGANTLSGKVGTGSDGKATISYVGGAPGDDTVTAFVDTNGNGTRDPSEAQAVATIHWDGPPAPVIGVSADVRPVKGTVKVKLPPGTSAGKAKRLGLTGAASGFVKLTSAQQIPMGSTLDTSKGTVNLLSADSKSPVAGKFNGANFNGGQFKLTQSTKNPLTELTMGGSGLNKCAQPVPKGGSAAATRKRRLFGSGKGHFRTRGRNSSATVRGTVWNMTDTCKGTLTVVSKGTVQVRDFTLRKNKTVKAGKRYFAKAPKLRKLKK